MKKFMAIFLSAILLCGCSQKNDTAEPSEATELPTEEATELEAEPVYNVFSSDRAIAVMIDNDGDSSRPHAGIEDAFLIYEMYVEGTATRLMAVFKGTDTPKIGPVRSSRHYFLDYALDCNALYAHAGWSPLAMEQIPSMGVNNLNGLIYEPQYFWRERKYSGDYHSLYTSIENLTSLAEKLGYETESDVLPFNFTAEDVTFEGESATSLYFPYASFYKVTYEYDEETGLYTRYINSEYHSTQSGEKLSAEQIIIQFVSNYNLGDGSARQQLDTVGEGNAILVSNGVQVPLTWSRESRTSKLVFYTEYGEELTLDAMGQTYVQVIPPSMKYTIE